MKRAVLLVLLVIIAVNLLGLRNWQIHTNTTHIYDMLELNNKIYLATWGGLEVYDLQRDYFEKKYTLFDGLEDQDIRSLSYLSPSETLMIGTSRSGINRLQNNRFQIPINEIIGLPDNKVNLLISSDSLLYAATDAGLTIFKDLEDFPYPLPINHYATHNGLASTNITGLALSDDGYLFIGTDRGLQIVHTSSMFDVNSWTLFTEDNSLLPGNYVTSVSVNKDIVAVGTRSGVVRCKFQPSYNGQNSLREWDIFTPANSALAANLIFSVYLDNDLNVWVSYGVWNNSILIIEETSDVAVSKISTDNQFTNWVVNNNGLTTDQIRGFLDINGKMHLYSWGEGFFFIENNYWHNRQSNSPAANNITDIAVDNNGKVWVCNGSIGGEAQRRGHPGVSGFDGNEWTTFRANSSPLVHDRVFRITTDAKNRKWFGTWNYGISVYDEDQDLWYQYNRSNGLPANEVGALTTDEDDNIWISAYSGGMVILDLDAIESSGTIPVLTSFQLYSPNVTFSDAVNIFLTDDRAYFGSFYSGLRIWDKTGFPQTHQTGDAWRKPPVRELTDGFVYVYDIDSRQTYWGEEIWIAAESGLFMYEAYQNRWFRYRTGIKREVWQANTWQIDTRYFVDEERLYGAASTFPTAVLVDPFDRVWIGTESNGITMYDLNTESDRYDRYTIFNTENTPLVSNNITALAYEPYSGRLFIGTDEGLNSVEIGKTQKREDFPLSATIAYPNPFYPDRGQAFVISNKIRSELVDMPMGDNSCRIFNINGELIITLTENRFHEFSWDGNNSDGKQCSSGVYYYVVSAPNGQTERGTIVLVR